MAVVKVSVVAEVEGREPQVLGHAFGAYLEGQYLESEEERRVVSAVVARTYADALADAERRLAALAFYEVAGQLAPAAAPASDGTGNAQGSPA